MCCSIKRATLIQNALQDATLHAHAIVHFRVVLWLFFKARPKAQPFIQKRVLFACEWNWKRGTRQLGNGLFTCPLRYDGNPKKQYSFVENYSSNALKLQISALLPRMVRMDVDCNFNKIRPLLFQVFLVSFRNHYKLIVLLTLINWLCFVLLSRIHLISSYCSLIFRPLKLSVDENVLDFDLTRICFITFSWKNSLDFFLFQINLQTTMWKRKRSWF